MTWEEMTSMAAEEGFAAAVVTDTKDIPFDPSFRPLCAENLCGKYGANYSCPPDCGTPDEMRARIQAHRHALVLQTIWEIADYSDSKAIKAAKKEHNAATLRLLGRLRRADVPGFPVGASGCALCETCAIVEHEPSRNTVSMTGAQSPVPPIRYRQVRPAVSMPPVKQASGRMSRTPMTEPQPPIPPQAAESSFQPLSPDVQAAVAERSPELMEKKGDF